MNLVQLKDTENKFGLTYVQPEHVIALEEWLVNNVPSTRVHLSTGHIFVMANPIDVVRKTIEGAAREDDRRKRW